MTDAMRQELENAYLAGASAVQGAWKLDSDISRFDEDALFKAAKELAAHSVMAGKVAEQQQRIDAAIAILSDTRENKIVRVFDALAALAPYPERRHD